MNVYPVKKCFDEKWKELTVELNNGEIWKRKGNCIRCGKCCMSTPIAGCKSFGYEILNGIKVAKCDVKMQWAKPWQCKEYPTNPYDMIEDCGYSWEKI